MHRHAALFLCSALAAGCIQNLEPCTTTFVPMDRQSARDSTAQVYAATGDPYLPGPLATRIVSVERCADGAPVPLRIHAPTAPGDYPVVVFQHGFQGQNAWYDGILSHLASHGFVVVAPQMYMLGIEGIALVTAADEAELAREMLAWLPGHLSAAAGVTAAVDRLGLAGHSRGGKVAWLVMVADPTAADAIAGVDPVDGMGGPGGGQARVVQGPFNLPVPSLVIGTGTTPACSPAGDNHVQFYEASAAPAWHIIATENGHGDMLDDPLAGLAAQFCGGGQEAAGMRRLTAGLLVAFFRGALQGDAAAYELLTDVVAAPRPVSIERK